jgi:hypothetical protein
MELKNLLHSQANVTTRRKLLVATERMVLSQGCPGCGGEGRARNTSTGKTQLHAARTAKLTTPLEPLQKNK